MIQELENNTLMRDRRPALERHIQTFLLAVATAVVIWVGTKLMAVSDQQIAMKVSVDNTATSINVLNSEMSGIRTQMREFYLRSEAERTNTDIYNWLRRHDDRLIMLEREVGR